MEDDLHRRSIAAKWAQAFNRSERYFSKRNPHNFGFPVRVFTLQEPIMVYVMKNRAPLPIPPMVGVLEPYALDDGPISRMAVCEQTNRRIRVASDTLPTGSWQRDPIRGYK